MKWIVWKVTAENFTEEAKFEDHVLALMFADMFGKYLRGERYEVTKVGETPIW